MQFNSLFQLFVNHETKAPQYQIGKDLLFMPDALSYLFCGVKKNEFSIASTSQLLKPGKLSWETTLFEAMGVDPSIMQEIVLPGTLLGKIKPEVQKETGSQRDTCDRGGIPRYGLRHCFCSGFRKELGVHQFRHLVADGNRI